MNKRIAIFAALGSVTLVVHGNEAIANKTNFGAAMTRYFEKKGDQCLRRGTWPIVLHEGSPLVDVRAMAALEAIGLVKSEDTEVDGATAVVGKSRRYTLTDLGNFVKETSWPLDVPEGELAQKTSRANQVNALESVGLIKGSNTDVVIGNTKIKARRFALTDAASIVQKTNWPQDVTENELSQKTSKASEMASLETVGLLQGKDIVVTSDVKTKAKSYSLTNAADPFVRNKREIDSFGERKTAANLCWGKMALEKIVKWDGPWSRGSIQEVSVTYTYKLTEIVDWAKKPEVQEAINEIKYVLDNAGVKSVHSLKLSGKRWEAVGLDD